MAAGADLYMVGDLEKTLQAFNRTAREAAAACCLLLLTPSLDIDMPHFDLLLTNHRSRYNEQRPRAWCDRVKPLDMARGRVPPVHYNGRWIQH